MTLATLTVAVLVILLYTLVGRWLNHRLITAPMILLVVGAIAFSLYDPLEIEGETVHLLAEITLVLILFHDASTVRLRNLRSDIGPPLRLLAIGFPLALIATMGVGWWLLPSIGVYGALLLAASITPTDAGLGAPTVLNPQVPVRVRRMLNVESGLNDGLATPVVLFALTALAATDDESVPALLAFAVKPVVLALVVGISGALLVAFALSTAQTRGWASRNAAGVTIVLVPFSLYLVSEAVGANVFIAAFVAGLTFGAASKTLAKVPATAHLLETGADIASWLVWFFAGGLAVGIFADGIAWQSIVIAVLALTVLRTIPVAISLLGAGFQPRSVMFVGWFGPRGLATVVFALLIVDELGSAGPVVEPVIVTLAVGVLMCGFAHGLSASSLAARYGRWVGREHPTAETQTASEPADRGHVWFKES